jgi:hypothetical protein
MNRECRENSSAKGFIVVIWCEACEVSLNEIKVSSNMQSLTGLKSFTTIEEAEGIAVVFHSPVRFSSVIVSYNLSSTFTASSAVTFALARLALVTMRPSAKAKGIPRTRR